MTVRRYRPGDADAVQRLHERALRAEGTDPADVPGTDDLDRVREAYLDSVGEFLVVESDDGLIGMGGLKVDGHEGELYRMRVAVDRQGEGVGTRLLAGLERAARERGVRDLYARTARRQTAAVAFYPANGYEQVGAETHGEYDLVVYRKMLDAD